MFTNHPKHTRIYDVKKQPTNWWNWNWIGQWNFSITSDSPRIVRGVCVHQPHILRTVASVFFFPSRYSFLFHFFLLYIIFVSCLRLRFFSPLFTRHFGNPVSVPQIIIIICTNEIKINSNALIHTGCSSSLVTH